LESPSKAQPDPSSGSPAPREGSKPQVRPQPARDPHNGKEVGVKFVVNSGQDPERPPEEQKLYDLLEKDPQNAALWRSLGEYYFKSKQKQKSVQAFEKALELNDDMRLRNWLENYRK
jgi:hypothetical protein